MPTVVGSQAAPSDVEQLLVRSIEWTAFMDATFDTALEQANVILRYFLSEFMCIPFLAMTIVDVTAQAVVAWKWRRLF